MVAREQVPVRTILATIGLVIAAALALLLVQRTARVLTWIVLAGLFAVALNPAVNGVQRRLSRCPRSMATLAVFLTVAAGVLAVLTAILVPLAQEGRHLAQDLPGLIESARAGRGPLGDLLLRINADQWLQENQERLNESAGTLGMPALGILRATITGLVAILTIFTLAFLMVLQGPRMNEGIGVLLSPTRVERARNLGRECARVITGYVGGNLLISVLCGPLSYVVLRICGVPFPGLIALFVALVDLIPLVGAALGATVAGLAAFTQSVQIGIAVLVFFLVYQQVENHLIQPLVYSRAVSLNPLTVLVAVLVLGQAAGILGALLAVPVAGIARAVLRDVWRHRRAAAAPATG
jgi:predicted PurR-regulated permease PerM